MICPFESHYLITKQLIKVLQECIERCYSPEDAEQLVYEIIRARKGAILDDKTDNEMLLNIDQILRRYGWL